MFKECFERNKRYNMAFKKYGFSIDKNCFKKNN